MNTSGVRTQTGGGLLLTGNLQWDRYVGDADAQRHLRGNHPRPTCEHTDRGKTTRVTSARQGPSFFNETGLHEYGTIQGLLIKQAENDESLHLKRYRTLTAKMLEFDLPYHCYFNEFGISST